MAGEQFNTAGLSDEEIAALGEDDGAPTVAALEEIIEEEPDTPEEEAAAAAEDPAGDEGTAAAIAAEAEEEEEPAERDTFVAMMPVADIENYDARMVAFTAEKTELRRLLNEGEIDMDDYEIKKDAVTNQETELRLEKRDAENNARNNEAIKGQLWQRDQDDFFEIEANKVFLGNKALYTAFNETVKDLASDPANAARNGTWFLTEAAKAVRESISALYPKAENTPPSPPRKPDLKSVPKTLGSLPSADINGQDDGEFAYLDKLTGKAQEVALAKLHLDPDREARYLRSA